MKPIFHLLLIAVAFQSVRADQTQSGFRFGERPKNSIFDPAGVLTIQEQADVAEPLKKILATEGIDVIVVILPEIGDAPPEHVAQGFAEKWATTTVNSVVLHVPGREDSPWIFPGKVMVAMVKPEVVKESITVAERRAASEPTDFGKVRAASIEASDTMRYWMGGATLRSEAIISERVKKQLAYEGRQRLLKLAAVLGTAAMIPLVLGIVFLVLRIRNSGSRTFPSTRIIARLGAPHSGGNSAVSKAI